MTLIEDAGGVKLHHGDCLAVLRELPDASVDAVVTDPPYGLSNTDPSHVAETITRWVSGDREYLPGGSGFMGKAWDAFVPPVAVWDECLRVLKPGGHLLAFAGSRTFDLMALGIRLAGFDVRDSVAWLYGSGFPKSLDVSKAIDKAAGAEREVVGQARGAGNGSVVGLGSGRSMASEYEVTAPATPEAERWQGWGTALKPAFEPIVVARRPLVGTVAANVLAHGTGALNIGACRVAATDKAKFPAGVVSDTENVYGNGAGRYSNRPRGEDSNPAGRWPANVVLDESQATELDQQADASRFFYVAKAPKSERPVVDGTAHPTVKPLALMRWLVRLVTPPGGVVLEPFAGSGTTVEAALLEGFDVVAVEREADYLPLIRARMTRVLGEGWDLL